MNEKWKVPSEWLSADNGMIHMMIIIILLQSMCIFDMDDNDEDGTPLVWRS